jgi:hypothetical protein
MLYQLLFLNVVSIYFSQLSAIIFKLHKLTLPHTHGNNYKIHACMVHLIIVYFSSFIMLQTQIA